MKKEPKKIIILLGHPDKATLCGGMADIYEEHARQAGHEVRRANIGELKFDPILHMGYKTIQELEPDLKKLQEDMKWADHLVVIYPNWWSTMPALLKGLFDRMWLPGFAFGFEKQGWRAQLHLWKRYMKGKTARVFVLSGTHPFLLWLFFGDYTNEIGRGIMWFAGYKTSITRMGPTDHNPPEWLKNSWKRKVEKLARLGK